MDKDQIKSANSSSLEQQTKIIKLILLNNIKKHIIFYIKACLQIIILSKEDGHMINVSNNLNSKLR